MPTPAPARPAPGDEPSAFSGTSSPRALGLSAGCAPRGTPRTWRSQIGWPRLRWRRLLRPEVRLPVGDADVWLAPWLAVLGAWTQGPRLAPWAQGTFSGAACRRCSAPCSRPCAAASACPGHSAVSTSELPQAICGHSVALPHPGWPRPSRRPSLCSGRGKRAQSLYGTSPAPCLSQILPCCSAASPWAQAAFSGAGGSAFAACCKSSGPSFTLPPTSGLNGLSGRGLGSGDPGGEPGGRGRLVGGAALWAGPPCGRGHPTGSRGS